MSKLISVFMKLKQKDRHIADLFIFFYIIISYKYTITGIVTIDNNVVSTYNELAYAASLS